MAQSDMPDADVFTNIDWALREPFIFTLVDSPLKRSVHTNPVLS